MKFRKDFVTNSSSSSYVCEICGRTESGWDMSLSECGMVECVNGHIFCEGEIFSIPKEELIKTILEFEVENAWWCDELHTSEDLEKMTDDDLLYVYFNVDDARYEMPEECCPICQFIEYSEDDLSAYLLKEYGVPRDEAFAEVKKFNKRRKKLYENEYITYVCKKFDLDPAEIVAGWKERFGTYGKFYHWLHY
jgi:hypothetical protein